MLNEKALEAAHAAYERADHRGDLKTRRLTDEHMTVVITAYLEALLPADVKEVVTEAMVEAAWNEGKKRDMTGGTEDFRRVLNAALAQHVADLAAALLQAQAAENAELREALQSIVGAKALAGVRALVAGWNGEGLPNGPYAERHPPRLGATLPKTNCGAVYELDEAMQRALSLVTKEGRDHG